MTRVQLQDKVCEAFYAAVLLSGDMAIAEEAVHEAILCLDMEDLATEALSTCVATLSIQRTAGNPGLVELPKELADVLKLPRIRRQCFVLRFILGLAESTCAALLHMDRDEICDATCAALSDLAAAGARRICVPMIEHAAERPAQ